MPTLWLPEPPEGSTVTLGADFSDSDDWSAIRGRTEDCYAFTPRHGDDEPTIWQPGEVGGKVPRTQVNDAIAAAFERFRVVRFYYDPFGWKTEGEGWQQLYGEHIVIPWATNRPAPMHEALVRHHTDLTNRIIRHDGCPLTSLAMDNARKVPAGRRYILGKPSHHQKIDPAMADVLAHEAWADATAADEWDSGADELPPLSFGM
jgi:phage terminase large subunit-like protein